jgi:hypothetical protein
MELVVQNTSLKLQDVTIVVEHTDGFVFSGTKSFPLKVLPLGSRIVKLGLVPLHGGKCQLPTIKVFTNDVEKEVDFLAPHQSGITGHAFSGVNIFVKPPNLSDSGCASNI